MLSLSAWLLLAVVLYGPFIDTRVGTGNVASDLAAIESLVERHTFFINDSSFQTIDQFRRDGRYFSQKSPVFHLVGAAIYAPLHAAGFTLSENLGVVLRALTLIMVILPMGALLWMLWDHPWARARPRRWRAAFVAAFALGSLATPLAVTLNHYVPAAAFLMMAVRRLGHPAGLSPLRRGAGVGGWTAASLACDVPGAALFAAGVGGYWLALSLAGRSWLRPAGLALGMGPLLLLYAGLNWHIVGSPLPPNMHEERMLFYEGSFWAEQRDRIERGEPEYYETGWPRRVWHATLGHRGIFWMMPLLALALAAGGWLLARRAEPWPALAGAMLFPLALAAGAMVMARDLGGGCYVLRHALAAVAPLYLLLAHPALWPVRRALARLGVAAALWGVLIAAIGVYQPWSHNTLSALPPLENLARLSVRHPERLPTDWIDGVIAATSVTTAIGWLDLGLEWRARAEEAAGLGQMAVARERLGRAVLALRRAVQADPQRPLPYYHLGIALDQLGHPGEAIEAYEILLALQPENVGAQANLGIFAFNSGQYELARAAWLRTLELAPHHPTALEGLRLLGSQPPATR